MYQWTVGIFISIILGSVGLFGYIQFKMKKNQEENIKKEILKQYRIDITDTLEPIILSTIQQVKWSSTTEYKRNTELFFKYLKLKEKYDFSPDVVREILEFKYYIPRAFFIIFEEQLNLALADTYKGTKKAEDLKKLFIDDNKFSKLPIPKEVDIIVNDLIELRNKAKMSTSNLEIVLKDYKIFFDQAQYYF